MTTSSMISSGSYVSAKTNRRGERLNHPPLLPLFERLQRLINTLSPEERQQPQSIEFFAERLRGRTRPTPNRGEIGRCLTQLGYTRSRQWRQSANGFRATWHAPKQS